MSQVSYGDTEGETQPWDWSTAWGAEYKMWSTGEDSGPTPEWGSDEPNPWNSTALSYWSQPQTNSVVNVETNSLSTSQHFSNAPVFESVSTPQEMQDQNPWQLHYRGQQNDYGYGPPPVRYAPQPRDTSNQHQHHHHSGPRIYGSNFSHRPPFYHHHDSGYNDSQRCRFSHRGRGRWGDFSGPRFPGENLGRMMRKFMKNSSRMIMAAHQIASDAAGDSRVHELHRNWYDQNDKHSNLKRKEQNERHIHPTNKKKKPEFSKIPSLRMADPHDVMLGLNVLCGKLRDKKNYKTAGQNEKYFEIATLSHWIKENKLPLSLMFIRDPTGKESDEKYTCELFISRYFCASGKAADKNEAKGLAFKEAMHILVNKRAYYCLDYDRKLTVDYMKTKFTEQVQDGKMSLNSNLHYLLHQGVDMSNRPVRPWSDMVLFKNKEDLRDVGLICNSADFSRVYTEFYFMWEGTEVICEFRLEQELLSVGSAGSVANAKQDACAKAVKKLKKTNYLIKLQDIDKNELRKILGMPEVPCRKTAEFGEDKGKASHQEKENSNKNDEEKEIPPSNLDTILKRLGELEVVEKIDFTSPWEPLIVRPYDVCPPIRQERCNNEITENNLKKIFEALNKIDSVDDIMFSHEFTLNETKLIKKVGRPFQTRFDAIDMPEGDILLFASKRVEGHALVNYLQARGGITRKYKLYNPEKNEDKFVKVCKHFLRGECRDGEACRYMHAKIEDEKVGGLSENRNPETGSDEENKLKLNNRKSKYGIQQRGANK